MHRPMTSAEFSVGDYFDLIVAPNFFSVFPILFGAMTGSVQGGKFFSPPILGGLCFGKEIRLRNGNRTYFPTKDNTLNFRCIPK